MSNGGIIGVLNEPNATNASGLWTLDEYTNYKRERRWPTVVPLPVLTASVWLDAADTSTITAAGGAVSQWNNKGTLGNFTQAVGASQPTTGASTLGGLNVIDFSADHMVSADSASNYKFMHDGTDHIIAAVWKPGTTSDPNAAYVLLGNNGFTNGNNGIIVAYDDRASVSRNNGVLHFVTRNVNGTQAVANFANNVFTANAYAVITMFGDPDNGTAADRSKMYVNAGSALANNAETSAVSTANPTFEMMLGGEGGAATVPFTGGLAELIIVQGADATEGNRQAIRDYLNEKWQVY